MSDLFIKYAEVALTAFALASYGEVRPAAALQAKEVGLVHGEGKIGGGRKGRVRKAVTTGTASNRRQAAAID